jgi:hypothetical protein
VHTSTGPAANFAHLLLLQVKAFLQALSDTASLLTEAAGSFARKQAAQLAADVLAAADFALATVGIAEAMEQTVHHGLGAGQPALTSEGQQHQQMVAEAPAPQLQQVLSLRPAISHVGCCAASVLRMKAGTVQISLHCTLAVADPSQVMPYCSSADGMLPCTSGAMGEVHDCVCCCAQVVATTQMLSALSRGLLPSPKRTDLLARLLRCAFGTCMLARASESTAFPVFPAIPACSRGPGPAIEHMTSLLCRFGLQ